MATIVKTITPQQLKQLHTLLQITGKVAYKIDLMDEHSEDNRYISSSKELYATEADAIIKHLTAVQKTQQSEAAAKADNMRKKIISCCREIGWHRQGKADMPRIKEWVLKYGYLHKDINQYLITELPMLVTQAENMRDDFLRGTKK